MPIPDYQSLMLPVLRLAGDRKEHPLAELRQRIADDLKLSEQELAERLASDSQTVFASRIAWAIQYLKQAAAIEAVRRGVYKITDRGLSISKDNPAEITLKTLRQFPEFVRFEGKSPDSEAASESETIRLPVVQTNDVKLTPEESLESSYQLLQDALAAELLETIKSGTPAAFEKIVLGLDFLYVQAKRWKDVVGSPEIMRFSGSLTKKHANRGVFITTSWFSADALDYVKEIQQRIILIDGRRLASLMIEHNVGVAQAKTYTLKRLDQDYFENL